MKIAVVAPSQMPARRANTIQVAKMSQAFCLLGHSVRLASPTDGSPHHLTPADPGWEDFAAQYGLQCGYDVDWMPARSWLRRYDYGLAALRWARAWGADLIYTRLPQCAALASLSGFPVIYEMHDYPQGLFAPLLLRLFLAGGGKRKLVVISQALAKELRASYKIDASDIPLMVEADGVDLERYANLPGPQEARQMIRLQLPGFIDRFTAGYTGSLYAGRGIELILKLAIRLPEINFLLVGGEPGSVAELQKTVNDNQLENVWLAGFVPNRELPLYQACCEALLMPYQGRVQASSGGDIAAYLSPMKVFEYMACGRVILSSDLPVLREVLDDQMAVLLSPGDPTAWVTALAQARGNRQFRDKISAAAREAASQYSWEARAKRMLEE
jgi:glycosyltransferase involved in cell wall biosynthesis